MSISRLLLLTSDFSPNRGGVARYLFCIAKYFGSRIRVVTSVKGFIEKAEFDRCEQSLLSKWMWPAWLTSVHLFWKQRSSYDIVLISQVLPFGTAAWMASWFTKKPYIVIVHGLDVRLACQSWFKRFLAKNIFAHARIVVANSQALSREVALRFGVPLPLVVYPCVEGGRAEKAKRAKRAEKVNMLTVSRLIERKGHSQVLMALHQLKQKNAMPDFMYHVYGDGPMRQTLMDLAGQLHLDEVVFHAQQSDEEIEKAYEQADFFVMPVLDDPIDKEGFGLVFLEAASCGVPSISTRVSGVDEAILHEETGILIEPGNLNQLANAILLLSTDEKLREENGNRAKQRVFEEFSCSKQISKLEPYL